MNSILKEDLKTIIESKLIAWEKIDNHSIIITGATGLIGSILVRALLLRNEICHANIKMKLVVRNRESAQAIFGDDANITYIEESVENCEIKGKADYIIHGASPTKSKFFIEKPVETIDTIVKGTKNILEIGKELKIKSMVILSSMEIYGKLQTNETTEDQLGYIELLNTRSSYSEGKRMAELYSYSYFKEYGVPVKIARIAQTFGAGISPNENRVYKTFLDSILEEKDIIIKSTGKTKINYSYTTDTILGILYILIKGEAGEAYNIVGPKTNMTILDSAQWLIQEFGKKGTKVVIDIPDTNQGFAPENEMILNNDKLVKLGWNHQYDLKQGYTRLLNYMKEEKQNLKEKDV